MYQFTGYHQTNEEAARGILSQMAMKPGSRGLVGGGIYMAETAAATQRKATSHGVVLRITVRFNKAKEVPARGDPSITLQKLKSEGYDLVRCHRPGSDGTEWVVYDMNQVHDITVETARNAQTRSDLERCQRSGWMEEISRVCAARDVSDSEPFTPEEREAWQRMPKEEQERLLRFVRCFKKY